MFGIAGTVELGTICPGTGTWNRLQDGIGTASDRALATMATDKSAYTTMDSRFKLSAR